jgi:hypothetical protein
MRRKEWIARIQYYPLKGWDIPFLIPIPVSSKRHLKKNIGGYGPGSQAHINPLFDLRLEARKAVFY